ncbi:MAG TPA: HAD family hydrolase [Actinoplanes sp.]|nr:HAD family hydrolase [Actinoplanes sp.]
MQRFGLVATDIDGTLIRSDRTLSARTIEVLTRLTGDGVPVVLVTGRPVRWLRQLYDQLPEPLPAVCANGAVVYDPHADEVLHTAALETELLIEVVRRLRDLVPDVSLAVEVEDGRSFWHEQRWPMHWEFDHRAVRVIASPEELTTMPAVKLLARSGGHDPDTFAELVSRSLAGLAETTHSSSTALVEISAAGVTKAAGLAWVCEQHGLPADRVIAFGDMPNDVPMLAWAGHSVAVGNAHRAVRAIADEVTGTNDEDGVAAYLEMVFGLQRP